MKNTIIALIALFFLLTISLYMGFIHPVYFLEPNSALLGFSVVCGFFGAVVAYGFIIYVVIVVIKAAFPDQEKKETNSSQDQGSV